MSVQGSEFLSGQQALSTLSNNGLCAVVITAIFAVVAFLISLPRTLSRLSWLAFISTVLISLCALLGMIGAGVSPVPNRKVDIAVSSNFYEAFLAITGPVCVPDSFSIIPHSYACIRLQVFAYAGEISVTTDFTGLINTIRAFHVCFHPIR